MESYKISIWGTSKTGKTTYLAMLYHEALNNPQWHFEESNPAADAFVKEVYHKIFVERTFPKSTEGHHEYVYTLTHLTPDNTVNYVVELAFNDIAGEVYEWFYEDGRKGDHQNAGGIAPQAWFDRMSNSDGLLMLLDPSWNERHSEKPYNALVMDFLRQLRKRRKVADSHDPRLQRMYIALCMTKADAHTDWAKIANQQDWLCQRADDTSVQACDENCPMRDLMPDFMDRHLMGIVLPGHVRCFLVSSIGRGEQNKVNVSSDRLWSRQLTPPPPPIDPTRTAPADVQSAYRTLEDQLKTLEDTLKRARRDDAPESNYFPNAILEDARITPTNLLQPLEWVVNALRADDHIAGQAPRMMSVADEERATPAPDVDNVPATASPMTEAAQPMTDPNTNADPQPELVIATQNAGKLREYQRLLADLPYRIVGLAEIGLGDLDVEETGTTFAENATLKARAYAQASGRLCLADDSGLVVDALDGRPGVYSARYGTPDLDDAGRRAYLLDEMAGIPDAERTARFVCVIAIHDPQGDSTETVTGTCEGRILQEERDAGQGFGYDAVFLPDGYDLSFAELPAAEKNRISHRGQAAKQVGQIL